MGPNRPDPLSAKYTLRCTADGCAGEKIVEQNYGVRWGVGTMVPEDPTNPAHGRCPRCQRHKMKVVQAPEPPKPLKPKGFTEVPEK